MIRNVAKKDINSICNIYNHYVKNTLITFEEEEVDIQEMKKRVDKITKDFPFIVYQENGVILGYAYIYQWKERSAYRYSVESTIYLDHDNIQKGVGTKLYQHLIDLAKNNNFHVIIGIIALPNDPSVSLHEKLGFKKCAHFTEVGYKFDNWVDVGYWEKII